MIMNKIFIPTTSLNFNNILSTESVSPQAFYTSRGFGYSRWYPIPENNVSGCILLYESPAKIIRPKSDLEDHPLWIVMETDKEFPKLKNGIRYTQQTLYFNPQNAEFWFQTEEDMNTTLSMSNSSLETKMLYLYKKKIRVYALSNPFPSLDEIPQITVDQHAIESDILINRMKGMLYGYYIGANLSVSEEDVRLLNAYRDIQNIFAAIYSSTKKEPTAYQLEELTALFTIVRKEDSLYQGVLRIIGSDSMTDQVLGFIRSQRKDLGIIWNLQELLRTLSVSEGTPVAISWIQNQIVDLQNRMKQHRVPLSAKEDEIIVTDGLLSKVTNKVVSEREHNILKTWVNELIAKSKYNGKISIERKELADDLTKSAKNTLGEQWEGSQEKNFLNQLRRHISGDEFRQPWSNDLLSSVAAVLLKGDEWDTLLRFMQSKGMTNYRLAFAFYGLLSGFANLTRDFTDLLLTYQIKDYVWEVYKEFHGQLHGETIFTSASSEPHNISESNTNRHVSQNTIHESKNPSSIAFEIEQFLHTDACKNIKNKKKLAEGLCKCAEENSEITNIIQFIYALKRYEKYGWKKTNQAWKSTEQHFSSRCNSEVETKRTGISKCKQSQMTPSLFDNDELKDTILLLDDDNWINESVSFITDKKAKDKFFEDMRWFIDNHKEYYVDKKKGQQKGRYYGMDKSNDKVIARLQKLLDTQRTKQEWTATIYKNIPVEKIIDHLKKRYGYR